jgi:phosphohistidine phosphatase
VIAGKENAMHIYLVRHGRASKDTSYASDVARPLTRRGRADVERIAAQMAKADVQVHQIRHSGLLRTQETADIFASRLHPPSGVIAVAGLSFDDPVDDLARELSLEPEPVMLVGHNPFMERLVSVMLTGSPDRVPVAFSTSGTVYLEFLDGFWSVQWALSPAILSRDAE